MGGVLTQPQLEQLVRGFLIALGHVDHQGERICQLSPYATVLIRDISMRSRERTEVKIGFRDEEHNIFTEVTAVADLMERRHLSSSEAGSLPPGGFGRVIRQTQRLLLIVVESDNYQFAGALARALWYLIEPVLTADHLAHHRARSIFTH